ncbi:ATP-dependent DNA helicase RecG [Candidatus Phycosocius spiralis]|uniref:ATP-dependent DNA helicase RecG n=1 Tax=Candidatus Phycosocius spiralis TaxID=2815099 RepID=A0ABQ4PWA7_9PROT|nr:ATP-dependent DNA helicase RecG [Candidatus Phycosocius spiralis]GIU67342.1 ATP-dependent DNA helicase RecG [Candidatus Phycosocius spiralis]
MRPECLFALFTPLSSLTGVGPKIAPLAAKAAGGEMVRDLAFHLPSGLVDRRYRPTIGEAEIGRLCTIEARVERHQAGGAGRPYKVQLSDDTGFLTLLFFKPNTRYLTERLPEGAIRVVSGEISERFGERQMIHPSRILNPEDPDLAIVFEPIYRSVAGLAHRTLARICAGAAQKAQGLPEWLDPNLLAREDWLDFGGALERAHAPQGEEDISPCAPARRRLAYDELFARQVALQLSGAARRRTPGRAIVPSHIYTDALLKALPYQPTRAQLRAFEEIGTDMAASTPMLRLLQGDVGSGKTLVAAWSMARTAEAGMQSALMAPTEILARQHYQGLAPLMAQIGLRLEILTGKDKVAHKRTVLEGLANGSIHAICGTQALFQQGVAFHELGLVVVDEQHRFGVADRRRLIDKGFAPHVLAMSATPIPRTLAMAVYGDLDVSRLDEKPPGRAPIKTVALSLERFDEVVEAARRAIEKDDRVFWVCPLVEESEKLDVSAATERFGDLSAHFGHSVRLIHGRMSVSEKDAAMDDFRSGLAKILVATTVIEVGVDVPEASVMVIEHAERFGLAQLHQLRGRVGRGDKTGHCLLLYANPLTDLGARRIAKLRETEDGFAIAEEDFKLRGGGDLLGLRQSGIPAFKLADAALHADLLAIAQRDARVLVEADPGLISPRGKATRVALHLFDQVDPEVFLGTG